MINNQYTHDADPVSEDKCNIIIGCKYVNNTTFMCLMTYISIILRAWNTMEHIDTFPHKNVSEKKTISYYQCFRHETNQIYQLHNVTLSAKTSLIIGEILLKFDCKYNS